MTLTKRSLLASLGLGGLGTLLAGCNTLSMFSTLTPKETSVRRVAKNMPFGDGPRQTYDIYAPVKMDKPLPVLVFFYGGGWNSGQKDDYVWMGHALAAMGFVVAIPDYRLVPEVVYPTFLEDNAAAVKHVMAHIAGYGGDAMRLGLIGHSAGAYEAVMLTLDPRYLDVNGKSPVMACVGVSGPYDFYPFDVKESIDAFSQWPHPLETQPGSYVRSTQTRFLLLQSYADTVVGMKNVEGLAPKLKAAGDDVTVILYKGLSHQDTAAAFSIPFRGKGTVYADTRSFLTVTLG